MSGGEPITSPDELLLIKNDPNYNKVWPRALVTYRDVHGIDEPVELPRLPNDGSVHPALPAGTATGLVGTSSFYRHPACRDAYTGVDVTTLSIRSSVEINVRIAGTELVDLAVETGEGIFKSHLRTRYSTAKMNIDLLKPPIDRAILRAWIEFNRWPGRGRHPDGRRDSSCIAKLNA